MGVLLAGTTGVDWAAPVGDAASSGLDLLQSNVAYLFALPIAWVGYKIVRKVIGKIG